MLSYIHFLLFLFLWIPAQESAHSLHHFKDINIFKPDFSGKPVKLALNQIRTTTPDALDFWIKRCDSIIESGNGKINVLHIGDSHIQADFFSGRLRELLQYTFGNGGRGLVFPYRAAKTNNPDNYKVYWAGEWTSCKNVNYTKDCDLGVSGISISSVDSSAGVVIYPALVGHSEYDFTQVKLFAQGSGMPAYILKNDSVDMGQYQTQELDSTTTLLRFPGYKQRFVLRVQREDTAQRAFTLHALSFENDSAGVLYHAAGINGAEYFSWNRARLLQQHMRTLDPHLVVISLGTNEGFNRQYSDETLRQNARMLIDKIREINPQVSILLTLPGESLYRRRTVIQKHVFIRKVLNEVAAEKGCAVWDMYAVMGGKGCMRKWYARGFSQRDMVHYKASGYRLQAELLYTALMQEYLRKHKK